jgi:hypothetical protein
MKRSRLLGVVLWGILCSLSRAQTIDDLNRLWTQTMDALKAGSADAAKQSFGEFNKTLRAYWANPAQRDWKSRSLAATLYCQFPDSRAAGAEILKQLMQDNRDLNDKGKDELRRWRTACTTNTSAADAPTNPPSNLLDASAHYQAPGVHSATKGGYIPTGEEMSGVAVSPIPPAELLARRVSLSEPQKAVGAALARVQSRHGSIVGPFAVASVGNDPREAGQIGNCLTRYARALEKEFEMGPPTWMITVYATPWTDQVYDFARRLHGLSLSPGVVAYSVAEDMSLAGSDCGSMAHELVHLLIKSKFPVSPAWLEEGIASEVAVAQPQGDVFKLQSSWRDRTLKQNWGLRPQVGQLLDLSWSNFSATDRSDLRRTAAVQAMAAVFIRYLDSKGKLGSVYFDVRDHMVGDDLSKFYSYQQIVEKNLGQDVAGIDADFERWFQSQFAATEGHAGNNPPANPINAPANTMAQPCRKSPMQQSEEPNCPPASAVKK